MNILKSTLLAGAAALSFGSMAMAADPILPVPVLDPVVVPSAGFDWTGFYVGLGIGGSWQSYNYDGAAVGAPDFALDPSVISGEIVLGGNVQLNSMVIGLELTGGAYSMSGSGTGDLSRLFPGTPGVPTNVDFDASSSGYIAGLEARLGFLVNPNVLVYGLGGVSAIYSNNATTFTYDDPAGGGPQEETLEHFGNLLGTVGAGVEFALNDNLSLDLSYRYGISAIEALDIPELDGFTSGAHTVAAQVLFHF